MNLRTLAIVIVLAFVAGFAVLNWSAINSPMDLNFVFTKVQAPLGMVLLLIMALLLVLFLLYILYMQANIMLDNRRRDKDMEHQRELADQAELSRFTELRDYLQGELLKADERDEKFQAELRDRLWNIEQKLEP